MNEETTWIANGISVNEKGNLLIDAEPAYGNRKKWEGEMVFTLQHGVMARLVCLIDEFKEKRRKTEIAQTELKQVREDLKAEYEMKKLELADQLNLDVAVLPTPLWWALDD